MMMMILSTSVPVPHYTVVPSCTVLLLFDPQRLRFLGHNLPFASSLSFCCFRINDAIVWNDVETGRCTDFIAPSNMSSSCCGGGRSLKDGRLLPRSSTHCITLRSLEKYTRFGLRLARPAGYMPSMETIFFFEFPRNQSSHACFIEIFFRGTTKSLGSMWILPPQVCIPSVRTSRINNPPLGIK